jgi:hypothetical protein
VHFAYKRKETIIRAYIDRNTYIYCDLTAEDRNIGAKKSSIARQRPVKMFLGKPSTLPPTLGNIPLNTLLNKRGISGTGAFYAVHAEVM